MSSFAHKIAKAFVNDAEKAVNELENLNVNINSLDNEDLDSYNIIVHGMKSALAGIGEEELSASALMLEKASNKKNYAVMSNDTSLFIENVRALISKYDIKEEENDADNVFAEISGENAFLLREKIIDIKTACAHNDKKAAKAAINILFMTEWPKYINNILVEISLYSHHGIFNSANELADDLDSKFSEYYKQLTA